MPLALCNRYVGHGLSRARSTLSAAATQPATQPASLPPSCAEQGPRKARRHAAESGFTLVELFAVLIIISIVAGLAIPAVTKQMRDRRTRMVAEQIADQYRTARMRALGRGGAVTILITPSSVGTPGSIELREAVRGGDEDDAASYMPVSSCTLTTWNGADLVNASGFAASRRIFNYVVPSGGDAGTATIATNLKEGETVESVASLSVCFTPLGRAFLSTDLGATWAPLTTVPFAEVSRRSAGGDALGMVRQVLLLPSGAARLTGVGVQPTT